MNRLHKYMLLIGVTVLIFLLVIAYRTILPRTATIEIPGEGTYTGQLKGMTFHGYGTYTSYMVGGTSYEGEWKNGVFHGQGTLTCANGTKLVGEFVDGSIYGLAECICPKGNVRTIDLGEGLYTGDDHQGCDHNH